MHQRSIITTFKTKVCFHNRNGNILNFIELKASEKNVTFCGSFHIAHVIDPEMLWRTLLSKVNHRANTTPKPNGTSELFSRKHQNYFKTSEAYMYDTCKPPDACINNRILIQPSTAVQLQQFTGATFINSNVAIIHEH